eukprot:755642-Hanusia_phi.AAC.1
MVKSKLQMDNREVEGHTRSPRLNGEKGEERRGEQGAAGVVEKVGGNEDTRMGVVLIYPPFTMTFEVTAGVYINRCGYVAWTLEILESLKQSRQCKIASVRTLTPHIQTHHCAPGAKSIYPKTSSGALHEQPYTKSCLSRGIKHYLRDQLTSRYHQRAATRTMVTTGFW